MVVAVPRGADCAGSGLNFINVSAGRTGGRDFRVGRAPSDGRLHLHISALCVLRRQQGRVLDGGVGILQAVEGAGTPVIGRAAHQIT